MSLPCPILPLVKVRRISLQGGPQAGPREGRVSIDFLAQMPSTAGTSVFMLTPAFVKRYNILVLQNTSQAISNIYRSMSKNVLINTVIENMSQEKHFQHKTFSIDSKQIQQFDKEQLRLSAIPGGGSHRPELIFKITGQNSFEIPAMAPRTVLNLKQGPSLQHLSYLFFPYLNNDDGTRTYGTPSVEVVINENKIIENARLYTTHEGKVHSDEIHYALPRVPGTMKPGTNKIEPPLSRHEKQAIADDDAAPNGKIPYKGVSDKLIALRTQIVPNTVVHDLRVLDELRVAESDFLTSTNIPPNNNLVTTPGTPEGQVPIPNSAGPAYFSDIHLSRGTDIDQSIRFLFSMHYEGIVSDHTQNKWLLNNTNNPATIINLAKIHSIKVFRKRVNGETNINALGNVSYKNIGEDEEDITIIGSMVDNNGSLLGKTILEHEVSEVPTEGSPVGSMTEINLSLNNTGIRTFTGVDVKVNKGGGKHQYYAEIEFEDGATKYIRSKEHILESVINTIYEYFQLAEGYDQKIQQPYYNADACKFNRSGTTALIERASSVQDALSTFVTIFSDLTPKLITAEKYAPKLWKLIEPNNGTLENISAVLKVITDFKAALSRLTIVHEKESIGGSEAPSTLKANDDVELVKIINSFDHIHDSEFSKNDGYIFIPKLNFNTFGLPEIKTDEFLKYMDKHHNKMFMTDSNSLALFNVQGDPDNVFSADLTKTKHSYLTPSSVKINNREISFIDDNTSISRYDTVKYNQVFADIISENLGFDASAIASRGVDEAKFEPLRDRLITMFGASGRGLSVENFRNPHFGEECDTAFGIKRRWETKDSHLDDKVPAPQDIDDYEKLELQEKIKDSVKENPQNALFMLLKVFLSGNNATWFGKDITETDFNMHASKRSVFNSYKLGLGRFAGDTFNEFDPLPNHIKALISLLTSPELASGQVRCDLSQLTGQPRTHMAWYYENFMNIMEIHMLTGFSGMRAPIFSRVTAEQLSRISNGQNILCRLRRYDKNESGISNVAELKLSVYGENFLLQTPGPIIPASPSVANKFAQDIARPPTFSSESFDPIHTFTSLYWRATKLEQLTRAFLRNKAKRNWGKTAAGVSGDESKLKSMKKFMGISDPVTPKKVKKSTGFSFSLGKGLRPSTSAWGTGKKKGWNTGKTTPSTMQERADKMAREARNRVYAAKQAANPIPGGGGSGGTSGAGGTGGDY